MAKAIDNIFTEGLSGTVAGKMTLSQKGGVTIVGRKRRASTVPATDNQLEVQDKFKESIMYAKMAIKDPVTKAVYAAIAKPNQSAFNVAFTDAFTEPEIDKIETALYKGEIGDIIVIRADEFKIVKMQVVITTAAGQLVEQGNAVLRLVAGAAKLGWAYTTLSENAALAGTKITVTVYDRPGHEAVKEVVVA